MKKIALATALALAAFGAHAQSQTYGEVGYTALTAKQNVLGHGLKGSPSAIRGVIGYSAHTNLGLEAMFAFGAKDATLKVDGKSISGTSMEVDNSFGLYLKPRASLSSTVGVFARIGFARSKGTFSAAGYGSGSETENSFSYGAGMRFAISEQATIIADYMQYLNKDGFKVNGFTLGFGMKF